MQLMDLVPNIEAMTDDELREHLSKIRHSKTVTRAAAKKHAEKPRKQKEKQEVSSAIKLLEGITPEQLALFLAQHGG